MKIGILGGSFNPVHDGHIEISKLAIKKLDLDQLWLIPASSNPFKEQISLSYQQRINLIEQKIAKNPKIRVKNYQNCSKSSYKMLKKIQAANKDSQIFFIIGDDNLKNLYKWDNFDKLSRNFKIAIFSRGDKFYNLKSLRSAHLLRKANANLLFRIKNVNISSTQIRKNNQS